MMVKPRTRPDVEEVLFYNGYWLLDYGNGYYSYAKNYGYAPKQTVLDRINHEYIQEEIERDIVSLKEEQAKAEARAVALQERIKQKQELLEQARNRKEEIEE